MDFFTYEMLDLPDGTSVPILGLDDPTWDEFRSRFPNSSFTVRPVGSPSAAGLDVVDSLGPLPVVTSPPNMDILIQDFFGTTSPEVQTVPEVPVLQEVHVPSV